ncbi:hypothetical protein, partial [Xanthobacter flavus]
LLFREPAAPHGLVLAMGQNELQSGLARRGNVTIHTFEADRFPSLFENVVVRHDGEWWEV